MICFPNCKINLGLYITRRREDGYHDIETVFYPLNIVDVLEISTFAEATADKAETKVHMSGLPVSGNDTDNLVWKAYELIKANSPKVGPLDIFLHKAIPMGAGLGGGSADGAFMLRLLNDFYNLGFNSGQLAAFALQVGSDCPFFIYNTPKFATGRGEQMSDIAIDLSEYSVQVICPEVHVSTREAFAAVTPKPAPYDLRTLFSLPVGSWKDKIGNDFEAPVFKMHPVLSEIKQQLYAQGALYASMSGSGSAIFGIFKKRERAEIKVPVSFKDFYVE